MHPPSPLNEAEVFGDAKSYLGKLEAIKQNLSQQILDKIATWCDSQSSSAPLKIGWYMSDDLSHFYLNGQDWFESQDGITKIEPEALNYLLETHIFKIYLPNDYTWLKGEAEYDSKTKTFTGKYQEFGTDEITIECDLVVAVPNTINFDSLSFEIVYDTRFYLNFNVTGDFGKPGQEPVLNELRESLEAQLAQLHTEIEDEDYHTYPYVEDSLQREDFIEEGDQFIAHIRELTVEVKRISKEGEFILDLRKLPD